MIEDCEVGEGPCRLIVELQQKYSELAKVLGTAY